MDDKGKSPALTGAGHHFRRDLSDPGRGKPGHMSIPRFMIAAPSSGSGKTLLTCGLLRLLQRRGFHPAAFKCGPDYIDPMFHRQVLGIPSGNLDTFFLPGGKVCGVLAAGVLKHGPDIAVIEGVMGYFDGTGRSGIQASSFETASQTGTPVILVVDARGMSRSVVPLLKGFSDYEKKTAGRLESGCDTETGSPGIRGVFLNRVSAGMFPVMKKWIEEETGLRVAGYMPQDPSISWGSRHLGLLQPDEIRDLQEQVDRLADRLEKTVDWEILLEIAGGALPMRTETGRPGPAPETAGGAMPSVTETVWPGPVSVQTGIGMRSGTGAGAAGKEDRFDDPVRIAVARDEAFSFYYEENLDLLREAGAGLVFFSPLHDSTFPRADGLILGGGYPELHARELADNEGMKAQIRSLAGAGMPVLAECGGFMYLQEKLELAGEVFPMCGILPGICRMTDHLVRFGYIEIEAGCCGRDLAAAEGDIGTRGGPGELSPAGYLLPGSRIRGHEFHYFDSTENGAACRAVRPLGNRGWDCIQIKGNIMAGFPHLYYPSCPQFVTAFLDRCVQWSGRSSRRAGSRRN